jgi:RimJ/RimL family protein N-acetyltransferase
MIFTVTLPTLTTERLVLRWLTDQDVEALFAIFSDPEVMRYWNAPAMTDIQAAHALLARVHAAFTQGTALRWGIVRSTDDRVIGTCVLFHLDEQNRRAEVGYALGRAYWGNGFIQEALTALLDYAFGTLALNRLEAEIDPRNTASVRAAERLGFVREGILRERWLVGGEPSDSLMMGLLRKEWPARRQVDR